MDVTQNELEDDEVRRDDDDEVEEYRMGNGW